MFSTPTSPSISPPTSPPPTDITSMLSAAQDSGSTAGIDSTTRSDIKLVEIDPVTALELRVKWLEAIVFGTKQDQHHNVKDIKEKDGNKRVRFSEKKKVVKQETGSGETLVKMAWDVQKRLDSIVNSNDGLKRFMSQYDKHAQYLTPAFALSGTLDPPSYEKMTSEQLDALLTEMEPDIRAADRDLREIELLEKKGVLGAGKLGDYEALQPQLDVLIERNQKDMELAESLEKRMASLVQRHSTHVDALSELFVAWDEALLEAELKATKLEREREERRRLGLEEDSGERRDETPEGEASGEEEEPEERTVLES